MFDVPPLPLLACDRRNHPHKVWAIMKAHGYVRLTKMNNERFEQPLVELMRKADIELMWGHVQGVDNSDDYNATWEGDPQTMYLAPWVPDWVPSVVGEIAASLPFGNVYELRFTCAVLKWCAASEENRNALLTCIQLGRAAVLQPVHDEVILQSPMVAMMIPEVGVLDLPSAVVKRANGRRGL